VSKPFGPKLLPLGHHLDGWGVGVIKTTGRGVFYIYIYISKNKLIKHYSLKNILKIIYSRELQMMCTKISLFLLFFSQFSFYNL